MHGFGTVYFTLGPEDAERVMGIEGFSLNSNWGLTLPFIPLALIFSRTTRLDNLFPILPIIYFISGSPREDRALSWPPSAAFTMASLPYARAVYYELWSRFLEPKEKQWVKEVQPRHGEDGNDTAAEEPEHNHDEGAQDGVGEGVNFELDFQVEFVDGGGMPEEAEPGAAPPPVDPPVQAAGGAAAERNQAPRNPPWNPQAQEGQQPPAGAAGAVAGAAPNFIIDIIYSGQMIIGALALPLISAGMGGLLKTVLPKQWTTPPSRWQRYPPGFLQSRFGRTIAGGCLFVVLKDTLALYSKYRTAQDHKYRRIVNYDPKKAKKPEKGKAKQSM